MDFTLTDDQKALRDLAARIFDDATEGEPWRTRGEAFDQSLWSTLGEAGILGIPLSEEAGGLGMGLLDFGLVLEQQGRTLAPGPLATSVPASVILDRYGSDALKQAWLAGLISGESLLAVALEEAGETDLEAPVTKAETAGNRWKLSGVKEAVSHGVEAAGILVSATTDDGTALFLVKPDAAGLKVTAQSSSSGEPWAQVELANVDVGPEDMVGAADGAALKDLLGWLKVASAMRQVGITADGLRRTAEYTSERIQFGRPIGSMQAVQQRMADGFIDVEAIRSTALLAAWKIDNGLPAEADIAAAKYWAAIGGHRVAHTGQHLHGGMGADVTYPIHRYFLAAVQTGEALGGARPTLAAIGAALAAGTTESLT